MSDLKKTNFVVCTNAAEIEDGMYLEQVYLLGWDNKYDWFADDIDACDIITPKGNIKKCKYGLLIDITRNVAAYVGNEQKDCQSYCDDANKEGYDCCVCRLEKDTEGEWRIYKV